MSLPEGLLLVDKPEGPTSHDVVSGVRRATRQRRIGHAGTLDPLATGLLPLVLGRATRLVRYLHHSPKTYEGTLLLGMSTASDDITGEVLQRHRGPLPEDDSVREAASAYRGVLLQTPPTVSARKVGGRRMYRLARNGESVDAPPREVEIRRFEVRPLEESGVWAFRAAVSPGTYIRALVRDLGRDLGCGGTLRSLRRLSIGPMDLEAAVTPDQIGSDPAVLERTLVPLDSIPLDLRDYRLDTPLEAQRFLSGASIWLHEESESVGSVRVLSPEGTLLGVGEVQPGALQPRVVLGS